MAVPSIDNAVVDEEREDVGLLSGSTMGPSTKTTTTTTTSKYRMFLLGITAGLLIATIGSLILDSDEETSHLPSTEALQDATGLGAVASNSSQEGEGKEHQTIEEAPEEIDEVEILELLEEESVAEGIEEETPTEQNPKEDKDDLEELLDDKDADKKDLPPVVSETEKRTTPKAAKSNEKFSNEIAEELKLPHVMYDDLSYRRICSPVGIGSVLCMTVKFPFDVPKQDPNKDYVSPFQPKFYDIDQKKGLFFIDKEKLRECEMATVDMDIDDAVQYCIEETAKSKKGKVVAVWTRTRHDGITNFHSTSLPHDVSAMYNFFGDDHRIFVLGESPSPGVTRETKALFCSDRNCRNCQNTGARKQGDWNCDRPDHDRERRLGTFPYNQVEEGHVQFGQYEYGPSSSRTKHYMPDKDIIETIQNVFQRPAEVKTKRPLRKLSLFVEYPIAHVQSDELIVNNYRKIKDLSYNFTQTYMKLYTEEGKKALAKVGYELSNLFVFDGLPQYFPTATAAYRPELVGGSEKKFIANGGYNGWKPEFGSNCIGPLSPNVPLKRVANTIREGWIEQGFDMRWYGNIWEFANMFWWQVKNWGGKGGALDCTHVKTGAHPQGAYSVHKFFLQAMINDFVETENARTR